MRVCVCVSVRVVSGGVPAMQSAGARVSARPNNCDGCKHPPGLSAPIRTRPLSHIRYSNNIAYNWRPVGQPCMSPCDRYQNQQRCVGRPTSNYSPYYRQQQQQQSRPYYINAAYNHY